MSKPNQPYEGLLDAADIGYSAGGGQSIAVTIAEVHRPNTLTDSRKTLIKEEVLAFEGAKKMMPLNATNTSILQLIHGRARSGWVGKQITLTVTFGDWFGERDLPAVRIVPPEGLPMTKKIRTHMGAGQPQHNSAFEIHDQ